jgi:hypothetical protein
MVKKLKLDDFFSELEKFYTESQNKYSVYLTFKRTYEEKYKYKRNQKNKRLRLEDRKNQEKDSNKLFNVFVRAKLKKKRINTIITPEELNSFHHNLMNILTLHFIKEEKKKEKKTTVIKAKMSKTQKRKLKKLKKIAKKESKMDLENKI